MALVKGITMNTKDKIYVAGHTGMVGSAIVRELRKQGYTNIITRTHKELDLCSKVRWKLFFANEKPEYVFIAAAKVGGIRENIECPADLLYINLIINANIMKAAHTTGVKN